jgi:hypothetical protein
MLSQFRSTAYAAVRAKLNVLDTLIAAQGAVAQVDAGNEQRTGAAGWSGCAVFC